MLLITCPWCGARDQTEFSYHGEAHIIRPEDPAGMDDAAWGDYVFFRANPRGPHYERWMHAAGCRRFLLMARDTLSGEIFGAYKPGEKPPPIPMRDGEGDRSDKRRSRENRAAKFGDEHISRRARAHNPPVAAPTETADAKAAFQSDAAQSAAAASGGANLVKTDGDESSAPSSADEKTDGKTAATDGGQAASSDAAAPAATVASAGSAPVAASSDAAAQLSDEELLRLLDSVGKGCFVRFFALFARAAAGGVGNKEAAEELQVKTGDAFATCKSRVSKAKKIFTAGAADRALAVIAESQKTPSADRDLAREILARRQTGGGAADAS